MTTQGWTQYLNKRGAELDINDYQHLWDGSDPGWKLVRLESQRWRLMFIFAESGPSLQEISGLRGLLDEFRNIPINIVFNELRGQGTYLLPRDLSNLEMRSMMEQAQQLGLCTSVVEDDQSGYLPIHDSGLAMIIEDNAIAVEVASRMLEAGLVVEVIHSD